MDRFDATEKLKWNQGAFDDGFQARMDGHGQDACPDGGDWFVKSWRAGWADADQCINSGDFDEFKAARRNDDDR